MPSTLMETDSRLYLTQIPDDDLLRVIGHTGHRTEPHLRLLVKACADEYERRIGSFEPTWGDEEPRRRPPAEPQALRVPTWRNYTPSEHRDAIFEMLRIERAEPYPPLATLFEFVTEHLIVQLRGQFEHIAESGRKT